MSDMSADVYKGINAIPLCVSVFRLPAEVGTKPEAETGRADLKCNLGPVLGGWSLFKIPIWFEVILSPPTTYPTFVPPFFPLSSNIANFSGITQSSYKLRDLSFACLSTASFSFQKAFL